MADKNIQAIYPLTPLQEGILFHVLESPRTGMYFNQFMCEIEGPLDVGRLQRAWQVVFARHAALRTLFTWERRDKPLQIVRKRIEVPLRELDWRDKSKEAQVVGLEAFLQSDRGEGFDLEVAPLSRITLIRLGAEAAQLIWSFHHILLDGWSVRLVFDEVMERYRAARVDEEAGDAQPSFETFVSWQRTRNKSRDEQFWRERLKGFSSPTTPEIKLHADDSDSSASRPGQQTSLHLGEELSAKLAAFAKQQSVTMNTVIVAAWSILLSRYCDSPDVVFGTTVSGRGANLDGIDRVVGLLINTLPIRMKLEPGLTLIDLLRKVQSQQVKQQEFEHTSLSEINRCAEITGPSPLFETIVVFENLPDNETDASGGPRISRIRFVEHSNFPLALLVVPGGNLECIIVHDGRRYSRQAMQQVLCALEFVLTQVADTGSRMVDDISATPPGERDRQLRAGTGVSLQPATNQQSVVQLFEDRVETAPDAVALVAGPDAESYGSLNSKANCLARRLLSKYEVRQRPVIIYAPRSVDAVVGMLAALKCGAVYVPMDVNDTGARLQQVVADLSQRFSPNSETRPVILTQPGLLEYMPATDVADVELIADAELDGDDSNIVCNIRGGDLAYLIYTSGSTGEPKGVMVQHSALLNSNLARFEFYDEQPVSFALLSSLATDSSLAGIYWTLCAGGTLVMPPTHAELDVNELSEMFHEHDVTHTLCVPSLYALILGNTDTSRLKSLRAVLVAGEATTESLAARHRTSMPGADLFNEYGPSEACVWATATELDVGPVNIGRPIANTSTYVLDSRKHLLPAGVAGELYIGGANVARGYLGRPDETRTAFLEDPFAADGSRMYRTGDRVRSWADGRLEFLGRCDQQIKIRGFRIEPGEVEAVLASHPDVDEAVVYKRSASTGEQLVAVVAGLLKEVAGVRGYCEQVLPRYMVPQHFAVLNRLPKTRAGKTDRIAVEREARFDAAPSPVQRQALPRTPLEKKLAAIWCEVIGLEEVYVDDNFFEIGGDSLMTIRILSRASREGLKIAPEQFFEHPTIAAQAGLVSAADETRVSVDDPAGPLPLLPIQKWFFRNVHTDPQHWNFSYLFEIDPAVETPHLERAITALVRRHAALRTRFSPAGSGWSAEIVDAFEFTAGSADLRSAAPGVRQEQIGEVARQLNSSFDLSQAPLLKACHFIAEEGCPNHLLLVIHHLVCDVESWRIIIGELEALLEQEMEGRAPDQGYTGTSLPHWAKQLHDLAASAELDADRSYWNQALQGGATRLPIDDDVRHASNRERDTLVHSFKVERRNTDVLVSAARGKLRASVYQQLLSALARSIAGWTGAGRVVFDTEGHGREPLVPGSDVSATVGWLTTVFPIALDADPSTWSDAIASLRRVKEGFGRIPRKGISFGILRDLATSGAGETIDVYDGAELLFNYLGDIEVSSEPGSILRLIDSRFGPGRSPDCERPYLLEINAYIAGGELVFDIAFSSRMFTEETIGGLGRRLVSAIDELSVAASGSNSNATIAEDFPLANLTAGDLESVADQLDALDALDE